MGKREPRQQGLAACGLLALLVACGPSAKKGQGPKGADPKPGPDAGADVEAVQISAIADALNEFGPAVHTCWARAAADDFHVEGQVVLDISFNADGSSDVAVSKDEVKDPVLEKCLVTLWSAYRWPKLFSAGDRIQLPPFEFVAPDAQYLVSSDHVPPVSFSGGLPAAIVVLKEKNTGNKAASFSKLYFQDQSAEQKLHTHTSAKLVLVISGGGWVTGIGKPQEVKPGSAVYVPAGTIHGFKHEGDTSTELLEFFVPGGPEEGYLVNAQHAGTTFVTGKLPRRGPKAQVRSIADAVPLKILDGKGTVRILFDEAISGHKSAYLGALSAEPGAVVGLHRHAESSEYLFVIEGEAEMSIAGRNIPVRAGDGIQIPVGVEHGVSITGATAFKALQLYTPAGPEQRFKGGGK